MRKFYKLCIVLLVVIGFSHMTMGQNTSSAIPLGKSQSIFNHLKITTQNSNARIVSEVDLVISNTKSFKGKVNFKKSSADREYLIGEISGVKDASFVIDATSSSLEGHIVILSTKKAYKYSSDASGNAYVEEVDINKILCIDFNPTPPTEKTKNKSVKAEAAVNAPEIFTLQSLPGAAGCIYLDFDGETVTGTPWKGGATIVAAPANMSDAAIQETWELVSEDYRPFNVNVTTNRAVFNSYPKNRRMMHISTTSKDVTTTGVAYIGSFSWNDDTPCWGTYTSAGKICGEVASHEVGHTFDLGHDGRNNPSEGYYGGAGNWAPIMGVSYYAPITTWSKGEYTSANNLQDDLATITGSKFGVGYRNDDVGNNTGSAKALVIASNGSVSSSQNFGLIERTSDLDFFSFTTGGGNITLNVNTVSRHGDLDILVRLYNESGAQIGTFNPSGLNATVTANLGAGKYYISVDGTGVGTPDNGYSDYASLGSYFISGNIPPGNSIPSTTGVVTAYKDCNYTGFSGGLAVGDYTLAQMNALGILDDDISSLRVAEGFKAILYADNNFTGASIEITSDNTCLVAAGWNDRATSLRIRPNGLTNQTGTYCVQNRMSGLFLDVVGGTGNMTNGANIQQWNPTAANNQQFEFTHLGDGLYKILAVHSGKSLDINSFSQNDGANVEQYPYNATPNQQFIVVDAGNGFVKLIAKHSGKVIEVAGFSTAPEANVQQWSNVNQQSGHWKIIKSTTGIATVYRDCTYNGFYGGFGVGNYTQRQLATAGVKDNDISSLKITSGYKVILYENDNFGGASIEYTADNNCVVSSGWNDRASSMKVLAVTTIPNQAPSVSLTSPANNANYNAPASITINANASDADGNITKVEFYNGGTKLGEDASAPYSFTWPNVAAGTYTISAKAFDNDGATKTSSSVTVKVNSTTPVNQAPNVSLTSPANNANYNAPASITINANASDADGSVTKVEFYNGGTKIGEDASAPYSFTWPNVAAGTYTISAKAFDNNGANKTSASVTVKVNTVVTDQCSGLATYSENNGYEPGSKVKNAGKQYECKEWPYSGWCNGASWAYAPGTGLYWQDAWYDKGTCSAGAAAADENSVSVNSTTEINIAPNPAENILNLSSELDLSNVQVTITDITGRVLINTNTSNSSIDVSNLSAGIYTITIFSNTNNKATKRFIKK